MNTVVKLASLIAVLALGACSESGESSVIVVEAQPASNAAANSPDRKSDYANEELTPRAADDMVFKVPSLRNVAMTAPYFHDGSAETLNQAVHMMAKYQLGVELDDDEARELEAWLGSLTGEIPTEYIKPPELPPEA